MTKKANEEKMSSPYTYRELFHACLEMVRVTSKLEKEGLIPDTCLHTLSHAQLSAHDLFVEVNDYLAEARLRNLGIPEALDVRGYLSGDEQHDAEDTQEVSLRVQIHDE